MIKIDLKSSIPIYEQISREIKKNILKGFFKENDPLPSVRKLAASIGVNPNTIAKAYQELERNNVIYTVTGRGAFIAENNNKTLNKIPENLLNTLKNVVIEIIYSGVNEKIIIEEVKKISSEFKGKDSE